MDFPTVYRELAGLDSILQAAGRCNREGQRPTGESIVTIFERTELPPLLFRTAVGATRYALEGGRDPAAQETMQRYFCELRALSGETALSKPLKQVSAVVRCPSAPWRRGFTSSTKIHAPSMCPSERARCWWNGLRRGSAPRSFTAHWVAAPFLCMTNISRRCMPPVRC